MRDGRTEPATSVSNCVPEIEIVRNTPAVCTREPVRRNKSRKVRIGEISMSKITRFL